MASRPPKKRSSFKREEPVGISIDIAVEKIRALPNPTTVKGIRELFPMPWIFLGEQPLRVRTLFRWLETRVGVRPNTGRVCPTSDLQSTSTLQTILGDLRSPSLFSPVSLLMVSEAENLRVAIAEQLSAVISVSAHSITLFSGRPTIRKEVLERLGGTIFNVPEFNDEQLSRWIEKEAQKCGGSGIESEAIHRLVRFFGRDLGGLSQEIEKLVLSSPKGARIKGELVEATSIPTSDRDSFLLVRKIAAHDTAGSVELCRRMVAERHLQAGTYVEDAKHPGGLEHLAQRRREPAQAQARRWPLERLAELAEYTQAGVAGVIEFGQVDHEVTFACHQQFLSRELELGSIVVVEPAPGRQHQHATVAILDQLKGHLR